MTDITIDEKRKQLFTQLSSIEYEYKHRKLRQMRYPGTGTWLVDTENFKNWKEEQGSSCLCCFGIRILPAIFLLDSYSH
jgi:hypothetical protein